MEIMKEEKLNEAKLSEAKEKLPISFLTDFVSRGWDDVGYLKETIKSISGEFSGTKKVEELLQALVDAYLVCIGQLELHLQQKDYLDTDLKESVDIHVEGNEVTIADNSGEDVAIIPVDPAKEEPCEGPECEVPPVVAPIDPIEVPTEETPVSDEPFENAFEFEAPEAEGVRKFEKPEVADFFVDFDDPQGEPISEKELYGEGEPEIPNEKIDDEVKEEA